MTFVGYFLACVIAHAAYHHSMITLAHVRHWFARRRVEKLKKTLKPIHGHYFVDGNPHCIDCGVPRPVIEAAHSAHSALGQMADEHRKHLETILEAKQQTLDKALQVNEKILQTNEALQHEIEALRAELEKQQAELRAEAAGTAPVQRVEPQAGLDLSLW